MYGASTKLLKLKEGDVIIIQDLGVRNPLYFVTLYKYNNTLTVIKRPCYGFKVKTLKK